MRRLWFHLQEVYTFSHNMVKIGEDKITELHTSGNSQQHIFATDGGNHLVHSVFA